MAWYDLISFDCKGRQIVYCASVPGLTSLSIEARHSCLSLCRWPIDKV